MNNTANLATSTDQALVSILIPVYNRQDLIETCVKSALAQTYENIEIVICDNASTDKTFEVVSQLGALDSRIRIFRNQNNLGPVRNWAECLNHARGEYSKILFSDDEIGPTFVERTLELFTDTVGFVFTAVEIGSSRGQGSNHYFWRRSIGVWPTVDYWIDLVHRKNLIPVSPGAAIFRTKDLKKNMMLNIPSPDAFDFNSHGAGPDLLLYLLTSADYSNVGFVNLPLSFFRSHPGSITVGDRTGRVAEGYFRATLFFWERVGRWDHHVVTFRQQWIKSIRDTNQLIRPGAHMGRFSTFKPGFIYLWWLLRDFFHWGLNTKIPVLATRLKKVLLISFQSNR